MYNWKTMSCRQSFGCITIFINFFHYISSKVREKGEERVKYAEIETIPCRVWSDIFDYHTI